MACIVAHVRVNGSAAISVKTVDTVKPLILKPPLSYPRLSLLLSSPLSASNFGSLPISALVRHVRLVLWGL